MALLLIPVTLGCGGRQFEVDAEAHSSDESALKAPGKADPSSSATPNTEAVISSTSTETVELSVAFMYQTGGLLYGTPAVEGNTVVMCEHYKSEDVEELTGLSPDTDVGRDFGETCHSVTVNDDDTVTLNWTQDIDSSVESSPVIANGGVYANTLVMQGNESDEHGSGGSIGLDLNDGSLAWRYRLQTGADSTPLVDPDSGTFFTGVVFNINLAATTYDSSTGCVNMDALGTPHFYALSLVDGSELWTLDNNGWAFASMTMDRTRSRIIGGTGDHSDAIAAMETCEWVPEADGEIDEPGSGYVMDLDGVEQMPRFAFDNTEDKTPITVWQDNRERYVFGTHDTQIVIYNRNGGEICRFAAGAEHISSPVAGPQDEFIYVTTGNATGSDTTYENKILAIDKTCSVVYESDIVRATTPLVTEDHVYVVSAVGELRAYTHELVEEASIQLREAPELAGLYDSDDSDAYPDIKVLQAGLTMTSSGLILVATANGALVGVRTGVEDALEPESSCPKFRCDMANTGRVNPW
jgi:hypothetical protein